MRTNPNDTAYPANQVHNDCDGNFMFTSSHSGLTKREHFAGLVMQGFCSLALDPEKILPELEKNKVTLAQVCAQNSVEYADALIEALNKGAPSES